VEKPQVPVRIEASTLLEIHSVADVTMAFCCLANGRDSISEQKLKLQAGKCVVSPLSLRKLNLLRCFNFVGG
jgi:hypothetical protein